MKKIFIIQCAFTIAFFLSSCGDDKLSSTSNSIVLSDFENYKPINYYLKINDREGLKLKRLYEYHLLDYKAYNLLYGGEFTDKSLAKDEVYLYRGQINILNQTFHLEDVYANINQDSGSEGFNLKILTPTGIVNSEEILSDNIRSKIIKENPDFPQKFYLLMFNIEPKNNEVNHFNLYFSKNRLLKMEAFN